MARSAKYNGEHNADTIVAIMKDVALTYGRSETARTLSKKHGVTTGRIQGYATQLRGYGIDVAKMRKAGLYLRAVDELRTEAPQIFTASKTAPKKRGRPAKVK